MKKTSSFLLTTFTGLFLFLSACQKQVDSIGTQEVIRSTALPGQPAYCRIESIWKNRCATEEAFHLILYDEFENPIAITTPGIGTGRPWVTFIYDSWHRLREY